MNVPDDDPGGWVQLLVGALISGAFAVVGAAVKQLWSAITVVHKRIDDVSSKIDETNRETEDLVDRRHRDNLIAIQRIHSMLDEDRKQAYDFRVTMAERLAGMATASDLKAQTERILMAIQPQRGQHHSSD